MWNGKECVSVEEKYQQGYTARGYRRVNNGFIQHPRSLPEPSSQPAGEVQPGEQAMDWKEKVILIQEVLTIVLCVLIFLLGRKNQLLRAPEL